jgi:LAO/AO transport system kinase
LSTDLASGIVAGDRRSLARAITLVESTRADHHREAEALIEALLPRTGGALRLGITGPPGVGKSTFIEAFGRVLVEQHQKRLAVLAVDPSSASGGGSILGDKTRMGELIGHPNVFVRPSPSGGTLGGIGRRTRDAIALCEAAGYDVIVVETVGVGQSETQVATVTDLFLLLASPGGGDDLQGIKRGVMELADVLVVNKADGDLVDLAARTAADYEMALHLTRPKRPGYATPVLTASALRADGITAVWDALADLHRRLADDGNLVANRQHQAAAQLQEELGQALWRHAEHDAGFQTDRAAAEEAVRAGTTSVSAAARGVIDRFWAR